MKTTEKRNRLDAIRPRGVYLANRRTSLRLENVFWDALTEIAAEQGKTVYSLISENPPAP